MKQILQNLKDGKTEIADVPIPKSLPGHVLIKTNSSIISAGTERMLVEFGKANLIEKARSQPEKVRMVLDKISTDGLLPTIEAVQSKLNAPLPLGYCNAGIVIDSSNTNFYKGQRVISNGYHAEFVRCSKNLCAPIPDNVDDESAAFTVLGAIALQGIRLAKPTIGESAVVIGLGLVGLLTVQILRANGCKVLAIDLDSKRCELAETFGAKACNLSHGIDAISSANEFTNGAGADFVMITASSKSNDIISTAANISRKKGRIVLVGVVGLEISRQEFFEKELSFQVSCSYGPGRYDKSYEENGNDYPFEYVRWTENRNFVAFLDLLSSGVIDVKPLISHRFDIEEGVNAYEELNNNASLGICLNYNSSQDNNLDYGRQISLKDRESNRSSEVVCSFIGAGNHASRTLIPAFKRTGAILDTLVSSGGVSSSIFGKRHNFTNISTDINSSIEDNFINTLVISTTHNLHASQVIQGIKSNKNIFVEKPLALTLSELDDIDNHYNKDDFKNIIMIGFNRRFSPHIEKMKQLLKSTVSPMSIVMTINAGAVSADNWLQNKDIGGGRVIGEVCHFIDLMRFLIGSKIKEHSSTMLGASSSIKIRDDKVAITLSFEDGSFGVINYLANGGKAFPKERIEVFCDDAVLQLNNFRELKGYGWKSFKKYTTWNQNKGQNECASAFVKSILNGESSPIPYEEIIEVSRVTIEVANSLADSNK